MNLVLRLRAELEQIADVMNDRDAPRRVNSLDQRFRVGHGLPAHRLSYEVAQVIMGGRNFSPVPWAYHPDR